MLATSKSEFEVELSKIKMRVENQSTVPQKTSTAFSHIDMNDSILRPCSNLSAESNIVFQQIDVEHYQLDGSGRNSSSLPVMRIFGVTKEQNSVLCHVHDFLPYLYVPAPEGFTDELLPLLKSSLCSKINSFSIPKIELVMAANIYGYKKNPLQGFVKIYCLSPSALNAVKKTFENGFCFPGQNQSKCFPTFESNLPIVLRFMIDTKMTGMCWICLPFSKFRMRSTNEKVSSCQIEADISINDLVCFPPDGEWSTLSPLRILSFDIECAGRKGHFPEAHCDPIIQIGAVLSILGEENPTTRAVFTVRSCGSITGANVCSYESENEMLMAWRDFFIAADPDIVIGYNICNFDLGYLLDRAKELGLSGFPYFGRIHNVETKAADTFFSSKAYGTRESKTFNLDGRIVFDLLQVMQRDYKLRSYSLNSVCSHFLGEQKEDVPHNIITDLYDGNEETRRRLAVYCLKDAYLPLRLLEKLMCLFNYVEMARVTGIPFNYILSRGQQVKVISQLYRKAAELGYVIPALKVEGSEEQYEGATVIEPIKGYYDYPIATLDFASLYPSIMMAHNLCYTTLVDQNNMEELYSEDLTKTPSGDIFVKPHIRKGILPIILEELIAARKKAKRALAIEKDPSKKAVLDGRQLALKISANSVYGFTGATIGKLPCIAISQSVTAFGREMIELTKTLVEKKFSTANGYPNNALVIYGDTDSVMVKFGTDQLEDAMKLGREAAEYVSASFIKPISLEFEKCYFPYLLINKKRYAGLYWTNSANYDKLDSKGIETVRRDNCRLVQVVVDTSLRKLLIDRDVEGAKSYVRNVISDLLQNKIDLSYLVITKALSKAGEDYAGKQAHVELAERMRKRDAASAPNMGDRVAYVIVKSSKGAAAYEKAEDPIYVLDNNLSIDTAYYLENQLSKPLLRIFEPILDNPKDLLTGDHTRTVKVSSPATNALSKFTVKIETCLGCKSSLREGEKLVCKYCSSKLPEIYLKHTSNMDELEEKYSRLWTQCQRCQGSLHQDILCTSRDCPIFYMRKRVQKDLENALKIERQFDDLI